MAVIFPEAMQALLVPIDSVKPWPDNPRSGDLAALKESINKNGFYQPVVVQRSTMTVIAGNHRKRALEELGASEIPVVWVDADDIQATRIALADNRTSDLAFYDDHQLLDLLNQLIAEGNGLEGTGYDRNAYELLMEGLDKEAVTGGIRQGVAPEERLDEYNNLDLRSIILPFDIATYERVAAGLMDLRVLWGFDTNADVVTRLVDNAMADNRAP